MAQFLCKIEGGKIVPLLSSKRELLDSILGDLDKLGTPFIMDIKVHYKKVNAKQISLYKALIIQSSEHAGMTFKEMEDALYKEFGFYNYRSNMDGEIFRELIKINDMDTKMFNNYTTACKVFINEFYGFKF